MRILTYYQNENWSANDGDLDIQSGDVRGNEKSSDNFQRLTNENQDF